MIYDAKDHTIKTDSGDLVATLEPSISAFVAFEIADKLTELEAELQAEEAGK